MSNDAEHASELLEEYLTKNPIDWTVEYEGRAMKEQDYQ